MGKTKIAGFRRTSYKTLQAAARKTTPFLLEINGMGIVQGELMRFAQQSPLKSKFKYKFRYTAYGKLILILDNFFKIFISSPAFQTTPTTNEIDNTSIRRTYMETIVISSISETSLTVNPNMFGTNFLSTFYNTGDQMFDLFEDMNITNLRFPGGLVEDSFSIHDPNRTVDDRGKQMVPIYGFLDACIVNKISATIVLPTRNLLGTNADSNGYRYPNIAEIDATVQFVENLLIEYAYLGRAQLLHLIDAIEIGNEYWGSGQMTATEYGRIVNALVPKLYDAIKSSLGSRSAEEIDLLVQMGAPWSRDHENGGRLDGITINSDPALLRELGLTSRDFNSEGNLRWRSTVDLENRLILNELSPETKSKIGGLVEHFYLDTPDDIISFSSSDVIYLDRDIKIWEQAGFKDVPVHLTEWNVQTSNHDQLGLRGGGAFLVQFSFMVQLGVDSAFVWPIQHNTVTDLAGSVGSVNQYSASGYVFQHLSEHIADMNLVDVATNSTAYQIIAFEDDEQTVFYVISRTDYENDVSLDLSGLLGPASSWNVESIEILGIDMSTSDGSHFIGRTRVAVDPFEEHDARGEIEELSQADVFNGSVANFHLDPYEIGMFVINHNSASSGAPPQIPTASGTTTVTPYIKAPLVHTSGMSSKSIDCSDMFSSNQRSAFQFMKVTQSSSEVEIMDIDPLLNLNAPFVDYFSDLASDTVSVPPDVIDTPPDIMATFYNDSFIFM